MKLLGGKSDFWRKAEAGGAAGRVNVKHNVLICGQTQPSFSSKDPWLDVLLGLELRNAARGPTVVTGSLWSSWDISFPGVTRGLVTLSDTALAQPVLQSVTLAGIFEIREGFCKEIAAKICVRACWRRHSHTPVTFEWELGENSSEVGQMLANKGGRVPWHVLGRN